MRKRVGAVQLDKYILPVGLCVAGYLVLNKFGLLGGSADNNSNNDAITSSTASTVASSLTAAKNSGSLQTVNDSQLNSMADSIYQLGITSGVDQDQIVWQVIQVNTLTDLLRLVQLFGTKKVSSNWYDTCSWLGFNCQSVDLAAFLHGSIDAAHLGTINTYLTNQGINYQF